jgi:hypothetical protein
VLEALLELPVLTKAGAVEVMLLLSLATFIVCSASAAPPPGPAATQFNSTHGSFMLLQRAPSKAAVYGTVGAGGSSVAVKVQGVGPKGVPIAYTVQAQITKGGAGELDRFKAFLSPTAGGGDYSITAMCTGCTNTTTAVLSNVTFGDLYYCFGQSNVGAKQ